MSSIVDLMVEAEQTLVTGALKKKWVLSIYPKASIKRTLESLSMI